MFRRAGWTCFAACLCLILPCLLQAQSQKEINQQTQFWWSWNNTLRFTDTWGAVADLHIRRNDFVRDPSFYFIRFGSSWWFNNQMTFTAGYAHMWQAPAREEWTTWSDENRIYQQFQYTSKLGRVSMLNRLRNEQRWQEKIEDDAPTGMNKFSDRIRYLFSLTIPVSKNTAVPALVLSDEILLQIGKEIVYNTFDQNRFFIGIRKNVAGNLSFDLGYMMVYQEKASGYQYDMNHTLRWFFYYSPDLRKKKGVTPLEQTEGEE